MTRFTAHRVGLGALGALGLALAATVALGSPAQAHNWIIAATPAEGETLTELPESFEIRTNEALLDLGGVGGKFAFLVHDDAGLYYGDGCVRVAGPSMFTTAALGEPGDYTVIWQYVSADGHTLSGDYGFSWAPEGEFVASPGNVGQPSCGESAPEAEEPGSTAPDDDSPAEAGEGISEDTWWLIGAGGAVIASAIASWILARQRRHPSD